MKMTLERRLLDRLLLAATETLNHPVTPSKIDALDAVVIETQTALYQADAEREAGLQ